MKIGSLLKNWGMISRVIGANGVDLKQELNNLPNMVVDMITKAESEIKPELGTAVLAVKGENNELMLVPVGFSINEEDETALISQELEALNVTKLITEASLNKLAELIDDENSQLNFLEKLQAAKID